MQLKYHCFDCDELYVKMANDNAVKNINFHGKLNNQMDRMGHICVPVDESALD